MNLAARHDRNLRVEQIDEAAQDAALRLTAKAEQNEIVTRQHRVDELWNDRFVVSDDSREQLFAGLQLLHQVVADLLFDRTRPELRRAQFAEGLWKEEAMSRFYPN